VTDQRIGLGGGCHWCTEAVFHNLCGVQHVAQGFIRSIAPNDNHSEAVVVDFDSTEISLAVLIEIHLHTHASTSMHRMRKKYRSAIYYFDQTQAVEVENILQRLQAEFERPLVTRSLPFAEFKSSDNRYHNYLDTRQHTTFCRRYIEPKLDLLRQHYYAYLQSAE